MMVDVGLNLFRDFLYDDNVWMGFGTGTTAATAADTALETEFYPDAAAREAVGSKTKTTSKKVRLQTNLTSGEGNGSAITESGILDAASGGNLYNHHVFSAINKTAAIELNVQHEFTFSEG